MTLRIVHRAYRHGRARLLVTLLGAATTAPSLAGVPVAPRAALGVAPATCPSTATGSMARTPGATTVPPPQAAAGQAVPLAGPLWGVAFTPEPVSRLHPDVARFTGLCRPPRSAAATGPTGPARASSSVAGPAA
jgi:hypothetical protein